MAELPSIGKISPEIFHELIFPRLGAKDGSVLVGPQHGTDVAIVEIGGQAVSFTTDPVFIVPEYGWEKAAWFAVHILASDSVTCGLPPRYMAIDLNLPMEITKEQLASVWETIDSECRKLGISIITGHTARYQDCRYPMVGGATLVGVGALDKYVSPKFIRAGDKIIITKGPAIEATGLFGAVFPAYIEQSLGKASARLARDMFNKMSVVAEATAAVTVGVRDEGVSAMHDATECGIWGGLHELAGAAGLGVRVNQEKIVVEPVVQEVCRLYGIDPYASISEGTLIIACRPHKADEVVKLIQAQGTRASVVGEFTPREEGLILLKSGNPRPLTHPLVDPFWKAFYSALARLKKPNG